MKTKLLLAALLSLTSASKLLAEDVSVTVDTDEVTHQVDPMVYGHFYEHIYHSANGGLWGNVVWNRSFEETVDGSGQWVVEGDEIRQVGRAENVTTTFGEQDWSDIDYTLQARKLGDSEGFLILFRVSSDRDFHWLNLGGWNNTQHGIEAADGGPKRQVGERVDGRIEEDRWYDIRIRTEGSRMQAWLDGEELFDMDLGEDQTPKGTLGLGTWSTSVAYRNIVVKDLEGNELWSGVPEPETNSALAAHWSVTAGQASLTREDPLNDEMAAELAADTTIEQNFVKFAADDPLKGSIWVSGDATVTVQAVGESGEIVAEQSIKTEGEPWKEYDVTLASSADVETGKLRIFTDSDIRLDQVNLLPATAIANDGFRVDLYEALAGLQPTIIRWPGGIYAEQYDWTRGVGPQHEREKNFVPLWEDFDPNSLGTDEFLKLSEKLGSKPLMVLNTGMHVTGTDSPEDWESWLELSLNWIEYCNGSVDTEYGAMRAKNGHPAPYNVVYWEIDNELWRSQRTDPETYARAVQYFAPAMRKKAEELGFEMVILAHGGNGADRRYNQVLLDMAAEHFDILSIHHYMSPNRFDDGVDEQEELYIDMRERVAASDNPEIDLYVSEWNAQTTDWRTGLYAGGILNAFERQGDFLKIGGPALLMREHTAGGWDNAFINFKQDQWFPAPNYVVMKLWREHFAPNYLKLSGETGDVNVVATKSEDGDTVYLKAVNPTDESSTVTVAIEGDFNPTSAALKVVAPGRLNARNTFENPDAVAPKDGDVKVEGKTLSFELPAYSTGAVTVQGK